MANDVHGIFGYIVTNNLTKKRYDNHHHVWHNIAVAADYDSMNDCEHHVFVSDRNHDLENDWSNDTHDLTKERYDNDDVAIFLNAACSSAISTKDKEKNGTSDKEKDKKMPGPPKSAQQNEVPKKRSQKENRLGNLR